jgi:hypothetical protein
MQFKFIAIWFVLTLSECVSPNGGRSDGAKGKSRSSNLPRSGKPKDGYRSSDRGRYQRDPRSLIAVIQPLWARLLIWNWRRVSCF